MELIDLLRIVRRWFWRILAIVIIAELVLWLGMRAADPVYAATARLQISSPQREDVQAYDEYQSISLRDEITVAINNLVETVQSDEVYRRTTSQLALTGKDARYTITAKRASDADFVDVTVEARTPALAAQLAYAASKVAIAYYGEMRAQSTKADENLFAGQLSAAEVALQTDAKTLADFRTQNGIYSLESQMATQQKLLEELQLERDQSMLAQAAAATTIAPPGAAVPVINSVAEVDKLIAQRMQELDQFTSLVPQYNLMSKNVEEATVTYQHLLSKYNEAVLKVNAVAAANFIQVVNPSTEPTQPVSNWPKLALLALAGSLGLGMVLAFFLEYISGIQAASRTAPVNNSKRPSLER